VTRKEETVTQELEFPPDFAPPFITPEENARTDRTNKIVQQFLTLFTPSWIMTIFSPRTEQIFPDRRQTISLAA